MKRQQTAAEYESELKSDPQWVELQKNKEIEHCRRQEEIKQQEKPFVDALNKAGINIESAWDLVNSPNNYSHTIDLLIEQLQKPYPDIVREGIARSLAIQESKKYWNLLVEMYKVEQGSRTKEGLAIALSVAVNDSLMPELVDLLKNRDFGETRVFFLQPLCKSKYVGIDAILNDLKNDPELKKEIAFILKMRKRKKVKS